MVGSWKYRSSRACSCTSDIVQREDLDSEEMPDMRRHTIDRPTEIHIEGLWIEPKGLEAVEKVQWQDGNGTQFSSSTSVRRTKGPLRLCHFLYLSEECDHKRRGNFIVKLE